MDESDGYPMGDHVFHEAFDAHPADLEVNNDGDSSPAMMDEASMGDTNETNDHHVAFEDIGTNEHSMGILGHNNGTNQESHVGGIGNGGRPKAQTASTTQQGGNVQPLVGDKTKEAKVRPAPVRPVQAQGGGGSARVGPAVAPPDGGENVPVTGGKKPRTDGGGTAAAATDDDFAVDEELGLGVKKENDASHATPTKGSPAVVNEMLAQAPVHEVAVKKDDVEEESSKVPVEEKSEKQQQLLKKRPSKVLKKVLVGRKETDLATKFLEGKRDLADTLSKKDCFFLARELWIFTHAQLDFVLERALDEESKGNGSEILTKLEASDILDINSPTRETGEVKDDQVSSTDKATDDPPMGSKQAGTSPGQTAPSDVVAEGGTTVGHPGVSGATLRAAAKAKLIEWKSMLKKASDDKEKPIDQAFLLSGAISCILTPATTNFFNTVKIKSVYSFLSLKKTETGAICDFFLTWRQKCGLAPATGLGIAKYLLGVNSRIETALSSVPPVDEDKRHWMLDPIIVMTGAARDFLIDDRKILTAFDFVHTRTKDLSLALAAWRQRKGFVPLKGSGKVAMISGWKATAKEVLEIESGEGRVLEGEDLEDMVLADIPPIVEVAPPPEKQQELTQRTSVRQASLAAKEEPVDDVSMEEAEPPPVSAVAQTPRQSSSNAKKRLSSGRRKQFYYDLHSKLFLDETIGDMATDILASVAIHTAHQLFNANEETRASLVEEILEAELVDGIDDSEALVEQWIVTLKSELDMPEDEIKENTPRKKAKTSEKKQKTPLSLPVSSAPARKSKKTKPHHKTVNPETTENLNDPFELLSEVTRRFLATVGIASAEQLLKTRTTDIAAEFVTFRKNEGMAELKGLGSSIASVSGWKANCRKYCKNMRDEYWDKVAKMEPPDKFIMKGEQGLRSSKEKKTLNESTEQTVDDDEVPFAESRRVFGVQGTREFPLQFKFDLSVRDSIFSSSSEQTIFVTYKGSSQRSPQEGSLHEYAFVNVGDVVNKLPILHDTPLTKITDRSVDHRATFQSSKGGCGLIELTKYGVRPLSDQDLSYIKATLRTFVTSKTADCDNFDEKASAYSNVIVRRTSLEGFQYLLNVGDSMEAGQTVPIAFPSALDVLRSKRFLDSSSHIRHLLVEAFHVLSKNDVRSIIDYLFEMVEEIGMPQSKEKEINQGAKEEFKAAVISRMRIHLLSCHLLRLAAARTEEEEDKREKLYFGLGLPKTDASPAFLEHLKNTVSQEFKSSLLGILEFDSVCGSVRRNGWCSVASEFFERLVSAVSEWDTDFKSSVENNVIKISEELVEMDCNSGDTDKWVFKVSPASGDKRNVIMCIEKGEAETSEKEMEVNALEDEGCELAIKWYKSWLLQVMSKVIQACGFLLNSTDFPYEELLGQIKALSEEDEELPGVDCELTLSELNPQPSVSLPMVTYQPHSYQFFLGIVWPTLREYGWRVKVIKYPSETKFVAPQWRGDHHKQGKLAKLAKQQRDRRRGDLARGVNQMGLGNLPKLTKRLFIASKQSEEGGGGVENKASSAKNVSDVTAMFLKDKFKKGKKSFDRAKEVIELVLDCFDGLAPSLCKEANGLTLEESELPRNVCSIELFMQFLLALPGLLTQSEIQLQEINDSLQVVQDLVAFCTDCSGELFPQSLLPPTEYYAVEEKRLTPHLVHRLHRGVKKEGAGEGEGLVDVIWEEDKKVLSDFVVTVMEQVVACRATEEDTRRKHRKIHVGYPGAVCRHCLGQDREGRYFFTTIESLTTLGTVFEKHFTRCTYVPDEIKMAIAANKITHHEQRKHLPNGSQQAYFLKLWDRLRTMRISGEESGIIPITQPTYSPVPEKEPEKDDSNDDTSQAKIEFQSPLEVLEYVRTVVPWKGTKEIDDALNQYYTCIDFGGRIYNTKTMPKHFSPAWLLAKVGPKQTVKKRKNLPG